jgi:uncharacterized protein
MAESRDSRVADRGSAWLRHDAASRRILLSLHVQPNARRNEIAGLHGDALKVKVAAPAVDNRANAALIEFLSETLGVPKSAIAIRRGSRGRRKLVEITGGPELRERAAKLE